MNNYYTVIPAQAGIQLIEYFRVAGKPIQFVLLRRAY